MALAMGHSANTPLSGKAEKVLPGFPETSTLNFFPLWLSPLKKQNLRRGTETERHQIHPYNSQRRFSRANYTGIGSGCKLTARQNFFEVEKTIQLSGKYVKVSYLPDLKLDWDM